MTAPHEPARDYLTIEPTHVALSNGTRTRRRAAELTGNTVPRPDLGTFTVDAAYDPVRDAQLISGWLAEEASWQFDPGFVAVEDLVRRTSVFFPAQAPYAEDRVIQAYYDGWERSWVLYEHSADPAWLAVNGGDLGLTASEINTPLQPLGQYLFDGGVGMPVQELLDELAQGPTRLLRTDTGELIHRPPAAAPRRAEARLMMRQMELPALGAALRESASFEAMLRARRLLAAALPDRNEPHFAAVDPSEHALGVAGLRTAEYRKLLERLETRTEALRLSSPTPATALLGRGRAAEPTGTPAVADLAAQAGIDFDVRHQQMTQLATDTSIYFRAPAAGLDDRVMRVYYNGWDQLWIAREYRAVGARHDTTPADWHATAADLDAQPPHTIGLESVGIYDLDGRTLNALLAGITGRAGAIDLVPDNPRGELLRRPQVVVGGQVRRLLTDRDISTRNTQLVHSGQSLVSARNAVLASLDGLRQRLDLINDGPAAPVPGARATVEARIGWQAALVELLDAQLTDTEPSAPAEPDAVDNALTARLTTPSAQPGPPAPRGLDPESVALDGAQMAALITNAIGARTDVGPVHAATAQMFQPDSTHEPDPQVGLD